MAHSATTHSPDHAIPFSRAPRLQTATSHRKVGWLELFYDLVYVATVVQLGNKLSEDVSLDGFIAFVLLFVPIWWVWMGTTFYANRFDADDPPHRLLIFGQIFVVSALAISVYDGLGETAIGFALAYAAARFLLVLMYLRAARYVPEARALARRYAVGFALAAIVWAISAFVPPPFRFFVWGVGLGIDFLTPLSPQSRRLQRQLPPSPHHLPERLGLFTIIVFGESFIKVIGGFAGEEHLIVSHVILGALGLGLVGLLWWVYFENVADRAVDWATGGTRWIYTHLPLQLALVALAVGIYKLIHLEDTSSIPDKYRLLVTGSVALALVATAIIERHTVKNPGERPGHIEFPVRIIGAVVILALGLFGSGVDAIVLMVLVAAVCLVQVGMDLLARAGRNIESAGTEIEV
ncbi:MAG: low temperature requirement protein A [Anaerolinea sp.]|nr:low temperature requirement protein A [Anaerolinea sp.]